MVSEIFFKVNVFWLACYVIGLLRATNHQLIKVHDILILLSYSLGLALLKFSFQGRVIFCCKSDAVFIAHGSITFFSILKCFEKMEQ